MEIKSAHFFGACVALAAVLSKISQIKVVVIPHNKWQ